MAVAPLWQLAQLPVMPAWSNRAPDQLLVVWQALQSCEVCGCTIGLPTVWTPSWHEEQLAVTPLWSKRAIGHWRVV